MTELQMNRALDLAERFVASPERLAHAAEAATHVQASQMAREPRVERLRRKAAEAAIADGKDRYRDPIDGKVRRFDHPNRGL